MVNLWCLPIVSSNTFTSEFSILLVTPPKKHHTLNFYRIFSQVMELQHHHTVTNQQRPIYPRPAQASHYKGLEEIDAWRLKSYLCISASPLQFSFSSPNLQMPQTNSQQLHAYCLVTKSVLTDPTIHAQTQSPHHTNYNISQTIIGHDQLHVHSKFKNQRLSSATEDPSNRQYYISIFL